MTGKTTSRGKTNPAPEYNALPGGWVSPKTNRHTHVEISREILAALLVQQVVNMQCKQGAFLGIIGIRGVWGVPIVVTGEAQHLS